MGRSVPRGRVVLAALLLAAGVLTGCGGDPAPTPAPDPDPDRVVVPKDDTVVIPEDDTVVVAEEEETPVETPPDDGCPENHPQPTTLKPIAPEYAYLVAQLFACINASGDSLYVDNRSLTVWQLWQPQYPPITEETGDTTLDTFRAVMAERPVTWLLLEPGQAIFFPTADGFLLLPEDAATAVWHTVLATETVRVNRALGSAGEEFGNGAPGRQVAADCGLAAFDAVKTITSLEELEQKRQQAPGLFVLDVFGLTTGAGGCADSVRAWQQVRQPAGPAFTDELTRAMAKTQQVSFFDDIVRYALQASPR